MVKVNGKKFKIYDLDTNDSVIARISSNLHTIPKYLYFSEQINIKDNSDITVDNTLDYIKKSAEETTDFQKFLKKFLKRYAVLNLDIKKDILEVWLAYNTQLEQISEFDTSILLSTGTELSKEGYFEDEKDFQNFWNNERDKKKTDIENLIKSHEDNTKGYIELYKTFHNIKEEDEIAYTDFNLEQTKIEIILDLKDITILEIFNHIRLNEFIPFANCKDYYKILKDFIPPDDWTEKKLKRTETTTDNIIFLKMYEKDKLKLNSYKDYTDIKIEVTDQVKVYMKLQIEKGYLTRDNFIERFKSIFDGIVINPKEINETGVVGVFYFPSKLFNTYVFSDLVMNDLNFEKLINIDESQKATKRKNEGKNPLLNIHFIHPSTGNIKASIIQKFVERNDPEMRNQDREIFPEDDEYIRVRITKGKDTESVKLFQKIFSKLLYMYFEKESEIIDFYKTFIPDFGQIIKIEKRIVIKKDLKRIAPDLFLSNYTRKCLNSPDIITKQEAEQITDPSKVMLFPRNTQEDGVKYPSDGKNQHYYKCTDPNYPYPGVQVNKLSNKDDYPYIPCCFKENQLEKKGAPYNIYYRNEEKELKDKKQQDFISTNKFVSNNQFGTIPQDLENFLKLIDPDISYSYVRIGVSNNETTGKQSFIKSVMLGLQEYLKLEYSNDQEFDSQVYANRKEFSKDSIAVLSRQSMYDYTIENVIQKISDIDSYFDPKFYLQLLESFFKCNIFVFKKTDNETQLIIPRHIQGYYKYNMQKYPTVLIYEHMGSESDNASNPRCELIVKWKKGERQGTEYFFQKDSLISLNIMNFFNLLNETYSIDKKITDVSFPIKKYSLTSVSQYIDSYGKTRRININYEGINVSLITSPIQPLGINEDSQSTIYKTNTDIALKIFNLLNIQVESQTLNSNYLQEINGIFGNVNITIPIKDQEPLPNIPINKTGLHFPDSDTSALDIYNKNKKISRYIKEYTLWLFSTYINENKIDNLTDEVFLNFSQDKITIKPFTYKIVPKTFSLKSKLMDSKKLIISSEELLIRLMYFLKLYSTRNKKELYNYHTHTFITDYYVDITDFDIFPEQVILQGENSIDKWIQESRFKYTIQETIITGQNIPYFFKNPNIYKNKVFLAQNALSLDKAVSISLNWQKQGYNIGFQEELILSTSYDLFVFLYIDKDNITQYKIPGDKKPKHPINIIIYKPSNITFYITLLSFMHL